MLGGYEKPEIDLILTKRPLCEGLMFGWGGYISNLTNLDKERDGRSPRVFFALRKKNGTKTR